MLRVNRYLFIFLLLVAVCYGMLALFVQSDYFGSIVSRELQKRVFDETGIEGSFRNIRFRLLPPQTVVNDLEFSITSESEIINIHISGAKFDLGLWSLLTNVVVVDFVEITDVDVVVEALSESTSAVRDEPFEERVHNILSNGIESLHSALPFPVNSLSVKNGKIYLDKVDFGLTYLELEIFENFLAAKVELRDLDVDFILNKEILGERLDSLSIEAELTRDEFNLRQLELLSALDRASISGRYGFADRVYTISSDLNVGLDRFSGIIEDNTGEWISGHSRVQFIGGGKEGGLSGEFYIDVNDLESDFAILDELRLSGVVEQDLVKITDLKGAKNEGQVNLLEPFILLDLASGSAVLSDIRATVVNLHSQDGLYVIRDAFEDVHGILDGNIKVSFLKESSDIVFYAEPEFFVSNFLLGSDEFPILSNELIDIGGSQVVLREDQSVALSAHLNFKNSKIYAGGEIGGGKIDIDIRSPRLDLEELGPIAGIQGKGSGPWEIKIGEDLSDVEFSIFASLEGFSLLDFYFDSVASSLVFNLKKIKIDIDKLEGFHRGASVELQGWTDFNQVNGFDLTYLINELAYRDASETIGPIYNLLPYKSDRLTMRMTTAGKVWGSFNDDSINTQGKLTTGRIDYGAEEFDGLSLSYSFVDEQLNINDISLRKGAGRLQGELSLNTQTDFIEYDGRWTTTPLSDFNTYARLNLGLSADFEADFYGSGQISEISTRTQLRLISPNVEGQPFRDSEITIHNTAEDVFISGDILGISKVESYLNLSDQGDRSRFNMELRAEELRDVLGIISKTNLSDSTLAGNISLAINSDFDLNEILKLNLELAIDEFEVRKRGHALRSPPGLKFIISQGRFQTRSFTIEGDEKHKVRVFADGSLDSQYNLSTSFTLPASLVELLTDDIALATGSIRGDAQVSGGEGVTSYRTNITSENVMLQVRGVDGNIENLRLKLSSHNEEVLIERFTAMYGNGEVRGNGTIKLDFPYPRLNIDVNIDNSYIPLFNRSGVVITGSLGLTGNQLPYDAKGAISILFGEVLEEINELDVGGSDVRTLQRFLPKTEQTNPGLLNLDIDLRIQRPVMARNNMLELYLEGGGKIRGTSEQPNFEGAINTVPTTSKFKFKGHEFLLSRGLIDFDRNFLRDGAYLDFSGTALINEYRVRLDVTGRTKTVTVSLSSEPALSQEDIFSLLTLGITSDISQALDESDRQSVATVGIGTLLADQFRLNEGLDSNFGLRLSVLPEFAPEETSLLQGKSAVSETGASRFRSATRVRLQKRVTDRVDLSVSSTVGGTLDQKQEMNVNYKFNNRWSLEGVYELRTTDDEGVETTDSLGADLKYRWTF